MPERPGFNPDDEQVRRQEFGEDDERLQPPSAKTMGRLNQLADRLLANHAETYTTLSIDFRLTDTVYAAVQYGRSNSHDDETWSLVIERHEPGEGLAGDNGADDDDGGMIAEFGNLKPSPDDGPDLDDELSDDDDDEDDEGDAEPANRVYDPEAFQHAANWARRSHQPQALVDALTALVEMDRAAADDETLPEAGASYGLAASKLLELGRLLDPRQVDQVIQYVDLSLPGGRAAHIWKSILPGFQSGRRRMLIQYIDETERLRGLEVMAGEPTRFVDIRHLNPEEWAEVPLRERLDDTDEADRELGPEEDYELDLASDDNVQEVIEELQRATDEA